MLGDLGNAEASCFQEKFGVFDFLQSNIAIGGCLKAQLEQIVEASCGQTALTGGLAKAVGLSEMQIHVFLGGEDLFVPFEIGLLLQSGELAAKLIEGREQKQLVVILGVA